MGIHYNEQFNATPVAAHSLEVAGKVYNNTLPLCRVSGAINYGSNKNDTLLFEVWLPDATRYNGRYISVGEMVRLYFVQALNAQRVQATAAMRVKLTIHLCYLT